MSAGVKVAETSRDPSAVTSVIRRTVRAGSESRYEAWFREVTAIAQTFPGHRGVDFIRPPKGSRTYTVVLHFDTSEHLGRWLSSDARKRLIAEIEPYLEGGDQVEIRTGLEFWFTPPDSEQKHAKTYKAKPIATLRAPGFVGSLIATAQFPTLNADFPRIELQIEPSTQLVGNRSSTLKPINLSGQTFNGDEESHG